MKILFFIFNLLLCSMSLHGNMILDMGIMMGGQLGASIANQSISAMYQNMTQTLTKNQTDIQNSISDFQHYVQTASAKALQNMTSIFTVAQSHIQTLTKNQQKEVEQMQQYILQAISLNKPQSHYLDQAPQDDQLFTLATMYTPQGILWKNVFPVGNWEYDEQTDSFWQLSMSPFLISQKNKTGITTQSPDKAQNNSIFAEWITRQGSYEIMCEITAYKIAYPFFIGIIFNKARWISGDSNRMQKYRLLGIYGSENQQVSLNYAEQITSTSSKTTTTSSTNILYPLQQIIGGSGTPTILPKTMFQNISLQPVTFMVRIITSPTSIQYKFWQKQEAQPQNFTTIKSKDADLFLYHGFGFMCPGAIAQFKIIKPEPLCFSAASKKIFAAEINSLLTRGAITP